MAIDFACPHCGRRTLVSDEFTGQRGPCAGCGETILIPGEISAGGQAGRTPAVLPRQSAGERSGWMAWLGVALVLLLLAGVGWAVYSQVLSIERDSMAKHCASQLREIGRALEQYHDDHGCYPPPYLADAEGRPQHSWRVLLLPYVGASELYERYHFDEAWDGPNNAKLLAEMPSAYGCPRNPERYTYQTSYVALVGPGRLFEAGSIHRRSELDPTKADSLVVIEVCERAIPWLEPRDVTIDALSPVVNDFARASVAGYHAQGAQALTAGGEGVTASNVLEPRHLQAAFAGSENPASSNTEPSKTAPTNAEPSKPESGQAAPGADAPGADPAVEESPAADSAEIAQPKS